MATKSPYELSPIQLTIGGNVTAAWGFLTNTGVAVFVGILVTVLGFAMNYYFKRAERIQSMKRNEFEKELLLNEDRRKQELHEATLKSLRTQDVT